MRKERGGFHGIITKVDQSALIGLHGKQVKKKANCGLKFETQVSPTWFGIYLADRSKLLKPKLS